MSCKLISLLFMLWLSIAVLLAGSVYADASTETVIYRFQGANDGYDPGVLISDTKGNLFGTTELAALYSS